MADGDLQGFVADPNIANTGLRLATVTSYDPNNYYKQKPFEGLNAYLGWQEKQIELKKTQEEYAAGQRAGEIVAAQPDPEKAQEALRTDPGIPSYYRQGIMDNYQKFRGLKIGADTTVSTLSANTFDAALAAGAATLDKPSPDNFNKVFDARTSLVSGEAKDRARTALDNVSTSLYHDLPSDPKAAVSDIRTRYANLMQGVGVSPATVQGMFGAPQAYDTGGQILTGQVAPPQGGLSGQPGGTPTITGALGKTLPPTLTPLGTSGDVTVVGGTGGAVAGQNQLSALPVSGSATPAGSNLKSSGYSQNTLGLQPVQSTQGRAINSPSMGTSYLGTPISADGTQGYLPGAGGGRQGLFGYPNLNPAQMAQNQNLVNEFSTSGAAKFEQAQRQAQSLQTMSREFDSAVTNSGGLVSPGALGAFRLKAAKLVNAVASSFGAQPVFDPQKIAAGESFTKQAFWGSISNVTGALGQQREGVQTLQNASRAYPGFENSPQGIRLLLATTQAENQRAQDQYKFYQDYSQKHNGVLIGADVAFNAKYPAKAYANQALNSIGMSENGFKNVQSLQRALYLGYVTQDQALAAYRNQFTKKPQQQK